MRWKARLVNLIGSIMLAAVVIGLAAAARSATAAPASEKKPNILVIWGDDIGVFNVSAYNQGMVGYRTPNIDAIAKEGALFTDWYGQQSCTAGRAAFITGQSPIRSGLTKVGLPGAPEGLKAEDPTITELLNPYRVPVKTRQETRDGFVIVGVVIDNENMDFRAGWNRHWTQI